MAKLGKEPRILVIGAKEYCDTITYFFEEKEVVIYTVSRAEKILETFQKARPDITIVDCVTPSSNGFAMFRWLRLDSGLPPHPCMLITVSNAQHRLHEDEMTAPTEFVNTPMRQTDVAEGVKKLVHAAKSGFRVKKSPPGSKKSAGALAPEEVDRARDPNVGQRNLILNPQAVGKKIMIVEDDQDHALVLGEFLGREGYTVIQSNNLEAFKSAVLNRPDLIVLDIRMPVLDGFALAEVFKACRLTKRIPLVFLSALHESRYVEQSKSMKAAAYVTKPVKGSNFLFTIGMVLKREAENTERQSR